MLERHALERFIDEYGDSAYRFAYGLCGNEADAKELVQEGFVRAMEKADQYDESKPFNNWFLTLLRNVFIDTVRRAERRLTSSLDAPIGDEGLTVADVLTDAREDSLIERLERRESGNLVRAALHRLTPQARGVLVLVDMEGLNYDQAAHALGCPVGTIRSRLNRARAALKEHLLAVEEAL